MSEKRLIVGLGNPGKDYEYTRHNLGFLVLRQLAENLKSQFSLCSFTNGLTIEAKYKGVDVIGLMPLTYMNHSGVAVRHVIENAEVDTDNILVICDDLNLDFAQIRVRAKGSDGGNNGLKSIITHLKTQNFSRLRMGIGKPSSSDDAVDYVLAEFSKKETKLLDAFVQEATQCALLWLEEGVHKAMDQFNKRK